MKQSLLFILIFFCQLSYGQYKVDSSFKIEYLSVFERLPEIFSKEMDSQFKNGLGLLTSIRTDTLNKFEFQQVDTSLKIYSINQETGESEPLEISFNEEETISRKNPMFLNCRCKFKGNNLEITTGISLFSSFSVITNLSKNRVKAIYYEHDSEGKVFKTKLTNKKVSEFSIPATINSITIDRKFMKGLNEIYGKMDVTTNGYYTYINAWDFKQDYIYKRMRLEYYFRCDIEQ